MLRILLADDHPIVRRHVRELLQSEAGWEVCAEAATGREAVALAAAKLPDVVVLDLSMPELNGLEAAGLIHKQFPKVELIILTMHDTIELMDQLTTFGVRTCILKTDLQHLVVAIRDTQQRWNTSKPSSNSSSETLSNSHTDEKVDVPTEMLTELEQQIVQMVAQSKNNKEVADALSLTVNGVEIHRAEIMCKLKINSVFELVHYALRKKLVEVRGKP